MTTLARYLRNHSLRSLSQENSSTLNHHLKFFPIFPLLPHRSRRGSIRERPYDNTLYCFVPLWIAQNLFLLSIWSPFYSIFFSRTFMSTNKSLRDQPNMLSWISVRRIYAQISPHWIFFSLKWCRELWSWIHLLFNPQHTSPSWSSFNRKFDKIKFHSF